MKRLSCVVGLVSVLLMAPALEADNAFYRELAAKPNATFEDAVRGFFELAVGVSADDLPFDKQAQALVDMNIIRSGWTTGRETKLTRGRAAYMICTACGVKGGLTMRVFGPSERYALRECVFMGVWEDANPRDRLSGSELMGLLKWCIDYLEAHPGKKPPLRGSAKAFAPKEVPAPEETVTPAEGVPPPAEKMRPETELKEPEVEAERPEAMTEKEAPTPTEVAPMPVKGGEYIVQKGDTFANISIRFYGTSRYDRAIMKANGVTDPWTLKVGQKLIIPEKPEEPE